MAKLINIEREEFWKILFEEAYDLNNYGEGTDLSRMVTTYLPNIEQSYKYFVERSVK